jgi:hypothetical protein
MTTFHIIESWGIFGELAFIHLVLRRLTKMTWKQLAFDMIPVVLLAGTVFTVGGIWLGLGLQW